MGALEANSVYQIIVDNIGMVYDGDSDKTAHSTYEEYVRLSKTVSWSRAYGESVTLYEHGEPVAEYAGHEESDPDGD